MEGVLVVARLKRRVIGRAVYTDVTFRQEDGSHRNIGTLIALDDMKLRMAPGNRGRFYVYDLLGTKGVYGARTVGARPYVHFPARWHVMAGGVGLLNLLMALLWYLVDGSIAPFSIGPALGCSAIAALFLKTRLDAMRVFRVDDAAVPHLAELCTADARA